MLPSSFADSSGFRDFLKTRSEAEGSRQTYRRHGRGTDRQTSMILEHQIGVFRSSHHPHQEYLHKFPTKRTVVVALDTEERLL